MKAKSKLITINDYFKSTALSQSKLLEYRFHPRVILANREKKKRKDLYYEEKEGFLRGSLLDIMLLTPELFKELYHVDELEDKPSDIVMSIIKEAVDLNISYKQEEFVELAKKRGYTGNNWSDEVIYTRLINGGTIGKTTKENLGLNYYKSLVASKGKQVISKEEYNTVSNAVSILKNHKLTSWIFNNSDKELEIKFQFPIYFEFNYVEKMKKIPSKALLDILVINHSDGDKQVCKEIVLPAKSFTEIDLKSSGEYLYKFESSIKRWRYDIQRAWYNYGLYGEKSLFHKNYVVNNPYILAISLLEPKYPKIYQFQDESLHIAMLGKEVGSNKIYGIYDLLHRMEYFEQNGFEYDINEKNLIKVNNLWE